MNKVIERAQRFYDSSEYLGGGSPPHKRRLYTILFPMSARIEKELYDILPENRTRRDRIRELGAQTIDVISLCAIALPVINIPLGLGVIAVRFGLLNSLAHHAFDLNQRRLQNPH